MKTELNEKNVFCFLIDIVLQNLSEKSTHIHKNRNTTPQSTDYDVIFNIFERKINGRKTNERMKLLLLEKCFFSCHSIKCTFKSFAKFKFYEFFAQMLTFWLRQHIHDEQMKWTDTKDENVKMNFQLVTNKMFYFQRNDSIERTVFKGLCISTDRTHATTSPTMHHWAMFFYVFFLTRFLLVLVSYVSSHFSFFLFHCSSFQCAEHTYARNHQTNWMATKYYYYKYRAQSSIGT